MTVGQNDPYGNQDFIPSVAERFWPRGTFVKGCHMWHVHKRAYAVCVRFFPVGCTSIQIARTLLDMSNCLSHCVTSFYVMVGDACLMFIMRSLLSTGPDPNFFLCLSLLHLTSVVRLTQPIRRLLHPCSPPPFLP
jgi:hypothetical protein